MKTAKSSRGFLTYYLVYVTLMLFLNGVVAIAFMGQTRLPIPLGLFLPAPLVFGFILYSGLGWSFKKIVVATLIYAIPRLILGDRLRMELLQLPIWLYVIILLLLVLVSAYSLDFLGTKGGRSK